MDIPIFTDFIKRRKKTRSSLGTQYPHISQQHTSKNGNKVNYVRAIKKMIKKMFNQ